MTTDMHPTGTPDTKATRKPVIGLMGEFSAGKSTLTNLLVGARSLPVQVTATQLPPVWLSHGSDAPVRIDLEGVEHPVNLEDAGHIDLDATQHIRVHKDADILELCDLIDMPGISDPNMAAEVWQRALEHTDMIIWCSHATQAWRQSEAAVWELIPDEIKARSILLLTRFDKITKEKDRQRVVRRVAREADGLFAHILPISLLDALNAGDDRQKWEASGAQDFVAALIDAIQSHANGAATAPKTARPAEIAAGDAENVIPLDSASAEIGAGTIQPRRVRRAQAGTTERPARSDAQPAPTEPNPAQSA